MPKIEIQIYEDDEQPDQGPLYASMIRLEEELAEAEGREPRGWYWVEGMDGPQSLFKETEGRETGRCQ